MNMELMNTFTNEQLTMCEKENLISYIQELKDQQYGKLNVHIILVNMKFIIH